MLYSSNNNRLEMRRKSPRNLTDTNLLLCDANTFADVLGVSPSYRQKESLRWNSAMQVYKRLSSQDLSRPFLPDQYPPTAAINGHHNEPSSLPPSPTTSPPVDAVIHMMNKRSSVPSMFDPRLLFSVRYNNVKSTSPPKVGARRGSAGATSPDGGHPSAIRVSTVVDGHEFAFNVNRRCSSSLDLFNPVGHNGTRSSRGRSADVACLDNESSVNALELEAIAAVHELQFAVRDIFVSELLPRTGQLIFLNVTTSEGQPHCVELTTKGWRVTSLRHDCMNGHLDFIDLHTKYFETVYALMDRISNSYKHTFSAALSQRLQSLISVEHEDEDEAGQDHKTNDQGHALVLLDSQA